MRINTIFGFFFDSIRTIKFIKIDINDKSNILEVMMRGWEWELAFNEKEETSLRVQLKKAQKWATNQIQSMN